MIYYLTISDISIFIRRHEEIRRWHGIKIVQLSNDVGEFIYKFSEETGEVGSRIVCFIK